MNDMTEIVPVMAAPIDKIAAALAKAAGDIISPPRNREVSVRGETKSGTPFNYKFKYATLDSIIDVIRKPLSDNGLWFMQTIDGAWLVTTLLHSSGQKLESRIPLVKGKDEGPQALGSALTYAKRYGLCALLGIASDEDDDANAAEGNTATTEPKTAQPRTVPPKGEQQGAPQSTDKGAPGANAAMKYTDDLIDGLTAPEDVAAATNVLKANGVTNIDGDEWTIREKSALDKLQKEHPSQFARVKATYTKITEKDIAA